MDFTKHTTNRVTTPQDEKVPGVKKQKINYAGGVSFKISKWDYLMRFLILGTEGGTYYVSEQKLTRKACDNVQKCIDKDGKRTVDIIVSVSVDGRAASNDAAIFALAMAASCSNSETRKYALSNINNVCRIGTHLFHFVKFVKTMRGFGRGLREALAKWYTDKPIDKIAYQMLKYQGRDGWTHADVLRLAHPTPVSKSMNRLFAYAVGKRDTIPKVSDYAKGMRKAKNATKVTEVYEIIKKYNLTREVIPTNYLNSYAVWEGLLENMPIGALVRNLGKMSSLDMHKPLSDSLKATVTKLTDPIAIGKSRIHPLSLLNASFVYSAGRGVKGSLKWTPSPKVVDALEDAFYMAFKNVEPTGKRIMSAIDVSSSMTGYEISGGLIDCRQASACLAMVTDKIEKNHFFTGFTCTGQSPLRIGDDNRWFSVGISELNISNRSRIGEVIDYVSSLGFSGTDCALPMIYAEKNNIDVDAIVTYTDNETWAGNVHPWQALDSLQNKLGHEVKCIVIGMVGQKFSIARPDYPSMIDFVGFDTNSPAAISEFIKM